MNKDGVLTAVDILGRLRRRYCPPQWLGFSELRISTGYTRGLQRLDFWAMHTYPSKSYERIGFEIKVSRGDFNRELRQPQKRRPALLLCNRFYFVAPEGVVPVERLPVDAGLIQMRPGGGTKVAYEAPWIETEPPTWGFVASLMRRAVTQGTREAEDEFRCFASST